MQLQSMKNEEKLINNILFLYFFADRAGSSHYKAI